MSICYIRESLVVSPDSKLKKKAAAKHQKELTAEWQDGPGEIHFFIKASFKGSLSTTIPVRECNMCCTESESRSDAIRRVYEAVC